MPHKIFRFSPFIIRNIVITINVTYSDIIKVEIKCQVQSEFLRKSYCNIVR